MVVSSSMHHRVGWRDYAERKMRTWLCPGLPRLCNDNHEPIKQTSDFGQPKVGPLCGTKCHVPNSCSSSQLVLRTWMLPSLASPVWRCCELNAGYRSISLVDSVRDAAHFPAQSRNHVYGIHVAVWTVCHEQWALNFTSSYWRNSRSSPSAARNVICIADPGCS